LNSDAYGRELFDGYLGLADQEIVERDDDYIDVSRNLKVYFQEYRQWSDEEKKAIQFARGRVLDIGCGAGRHALYLQKKGFDVLGIDASPLAIKVCKLRGLKKAKVLTIDNITPKLGSFDTLVMMGNNFGLFGNPVKAKRLLKRFHKMTSDNARIIGECLDPYSTDDPHHLAYHKHNRRRGRMAGQLRLRIRYKKWKTPWFDYLFVSRTEMKDVLKDTGWQILRTIPPKGASYIAIIVKT